MLSQYEALMKLVSDSPAKKDVIAGTEEVIHSLVGRYILAGFTKEDVLKLISSITEHELEIHMQRVLLADASLNSPGIQQRELYEAIGGREGSKEYQDFMAKRQLLANKWKDKEDSTRRRLVLDTLTDDLITLDPVCVAILVDNLPFITTHLATTDIDKESCLSMACLFGSRQTAEYLMRELGIGSFKYKAGKLFADMCLSFNVNWIKEVFETQLQSKMPLLVDLSQVEENVKAIIDKTKNAKLRT